MLAVTTADHRDTMLNDVKTWSDPGRGFPALAVNHLTKRFGDRAAFQDVSFEVGYGEVFGFLGPNGAGKPTTVRTLGTLVAPTSASATVAGVPLMPENGVEIRRRIAIMPESPGLYRRLSAENLEEAERLCDRVAILNTTRRTIGRPEELRERLFARTLAVRTVVPLPDPDHVFGGLPAVDGWRHDGSGGRGTTAGHTGARAHDADPW